jgi:hypothetical protein
MDELNDNILMNNVEISIYNLYPYVNDRMYYLTRNKIKNTFSKKFIYLNIAIRRLISNTLVMVIYAINKKNTT